MTETELKRELSRIIDDVGIADTLDALRTVCLDRAQGRTKKVWIAISGTLTNLVFDLPCFDL